MTTFILIGSGQSAAHVDFSLIRKSGFPVIACNNAYILYPDANILAFHDKAWHVEYKPDFSGLKFCRSSMKGAIWHNPEDLPDGCNTGVFACSIARAMNAKRIILCGFDIGGSHFHEDHPLPLKNPSHKDFENYIEQFASFNFSGEIVQCTKGRLPYKYSPLEDLI